MTQFGPSISTPITDFCFYLAPEPSQLFRKGLCAQLQTKLMDCVEAYGANNVKTKCADLMYDVFECRTNYSQLKRAQAIRDERMKQYRAGKIPKPFDEHPPMDSYLFI